MKPILEVNNLGKKYLIDHLSGGYMSLRERLQSILTFDKKNIEDFWALSNVSFDVQIGESIGIIGRNGAGKSTLLKILSKITSPTKGKIITRGRIASLLEVGTGFHPELTGRENIFFNGSLLGMKRKEIQEKFDEIVDFSGVEKFLDTPLKHFSSGMQLRLAFSVAAFLEPEILIIDEVLAVGDAEFQKKCLGKMGDVSRSGRTILFVSHNMQAVLNLCNRGIYLVDGEVKFMGEINSVVEKYLNQHERSDNYNYLISANQGAGNDDEFKLHAIKLLQTSEVVRENIVNGKDLRIEISYELFNSLSGFRIFLDVTDMFGVVAFRSFHDEDERDSLGPGLYKSILTIPANLLAPIQYDFKFFFGIHGIRMMAPEDGLPIRIKVSQSGQYNKAYNGQYTAGIICPVLSWKIEKQK